MPGSLLPRLGGSALAAAALIVTSAIAAACGDATGPASDVTGTYALDRFGDAALPVAINGTAGAGFNVVRAETLELAAGGVARLTSERGHTAGAGGGGAYDFVVQGTGAWTQVGDSVTVTLNYTGDLPWNPSSYAGTLGLRVAAAGGTPELRGGTPVRVYRR